MVLWLRFHAPNVESLGSIPGQGTRSHMPQIRVCVQQLKILYATTKTQCSQINNINKYLKIIYKLSKESYDVVPVFTIVQSKKLQFEQGRLLVQT